MAKVFDPFDKTDRWAVRNTKERGGWYRFGRGLAPTPISTPTGIRWQGTTGTEEGCIPPAVYERRAHEWYWLNPGDGPVKMRFKDDA